MGGRLDEHLLSPCSPTLLPLQRVWGDHGCAAGRHRSAGGRESRAQAAHHQPIQDDHWRPRIERRAGRRDRFRCSGICGRWVAETKSWCNCSWRKTADNKLEMISFLSSRYSSIPGRSVAGRWLSSPQAAGGGSETGHKTPEERKQQAQGSFPTVAFTNILHSTFQSHKLNEIGLAGRENESPVGLSTSALSCQAPAGAQRQLHVVRWTQHRNLPPDRPAPGNPAQAERWC